MKKLRIGFCTDLSGPYQAVDGAAGADAIRLAIAEMGSEAAGLAVKLLLEDHRNDAAEAAGITERLYDQDEVDLIISGVNSDTSLAITEAAAARGKLAFVVGAGTSVQTRGRSAHGIVQYAYNTVALATVPGTELTRRGLKQWFFLTADYPFGRELEEHGAGGSVVGSVRNPHGTVDFTPYIQEAVDSETQVLGLANGHAELLHAMSAMRAKGVNGQMKLVGLLTFLQDIQTMGLQSAQGLYLADSWFWTLDTESRSWAEKFFARNGVMPSSLHAADYSATLQFLRAVSSVGSADTASVIRYLRTHTANDAYLRNGRLRPDGTLLHDMYLLQVKSPAEATSEWDVYNLIATVAGEDAFPLGWGRGSLSCRRQA